jgi:hypothetical protein
MWRWMRRPRAQASVVFSTASSIRIGNRIFFLRDLYGKGRGGDRMLGQEDARKSVKGFTKSLHNCEKMHRTNLAIDQIIRLPSDSNTKSIKVICL